jgi:hypothetical protein
MSLVTRIYEVAVTIDQSFLDGPIDDDDEIEASRKECWEGIERDIQLAVSSIYGSERYRAIKIWKPQLLESEERHEKLEQ